MLRSVHRWKRFLFRHPIEVWPIVAIVLSLFKGSALALEYQKHPGNTSQNLNAILATGDILDGDTERLKKFVSSLPKRKNAAIYLASPGGSLAEGIKLGMFLRRYHMKSVVEGNNVCASACALAFLGGTDNGGHAWRSSSSTSKLGFHAFHFSKSDSANTDDTQKIVAEVLRYGKAIDAPIDLLIAGFETASTEIYWVSDSEICSLGIKLWSVEESKFLCN